MKIVNSIISLPILILALSVRITAFYVFGDHQLENGWLIIVNNLFERSTGNNVVINEYYAIPKLADEMILSYLLYSCHLYIVIHFFFKYFFRIL